MMRWTEQPPALPLQTMSALAERAPDLEARLRGLEPKGGLLIAVSAMALEMVTRHLAIHDDEQGGLLIGEVYAESDDAARSRVVRITEAVPSLEFASTGVSLRMESGVWEDARRSLGEQQMIVLSPPYKKRAKATLDLRRSTQHEPHRERIVRVRALDTTGNASKAAIGHLRR